MNLHRFASRLALFLLLAAALILCRDTAAADKSPREMMPFSAVVYAEVPQPQKLLDAVLDHPSVAELQNHPDYKKALDAPQAQEFLKILHVVEDKLGMKWRPAVSTLTGGGVYVAFDMPTLGTVVLTKSTDPTLAKKAVDTILELARADAVQERLDKQRESLIKRFTEMETALGKLQSQSNMLVNQINSLQPSKN